MVPTKRIQDAAEVVEWLRVAVHNISLTENERCRVAIPCFGITQDHHHAIVLLVEHRLYASSFSLLRIAFESYVRGVWLSVCATDAEIKKVANCWEPPKINVLISAIEQTPGFVEKVLSRIKDQSWKAMCAYTHTGGLHIQRWNTNEAIEPSYSEDEIEEVLQLSEMLACMSVLGIAEIIGNQALALKVYKRFCEFKI